MEILFIAVGVVFNAWFYNEYLKKIYLTICEVSSNMESHKMGAFSKHMCFLSAFFLGVTFV